MMKKTGYVALLGIVLWAGLATCAFAAAVPTTVTAELHDKNGAIVGHVKATQEKNGVTFVVSASNLQPGLHGMHIHAVGKCEGPDFKSAGPHFAFSGQMHGMENPKGPHLGDMPNLNVKPDGKAKLRFHTDLVTLEQGENSLMKQGGTALVIHEKQDDQKTDPSGNSGNRIACAVLTK
jgi:Cu-Zn family superoxide dismutase